MEKYMKLNKKIYEIISFISNKDQMTEEEYRYILELSLEKDMLVFGCGKDSCLWRLISKNVLFLEHNKKWINNTFNDTIHITYSCTIPDTDHLLEKYIAGNDNELYLKCIKNNKYIQNKIWDTILVDGPEGYDIKKNHGRIQSIFMAKKLANKDTNIFVHDINRNVEKKCCEVFKLRKINELNKLGHFKIQ